MSSHVPRPVIAPSSSPARPAVDEWGIYDPSQAGLEALFERLDARRGVSGDPDALRVAAAMEDARRRLAPKE